MPAKYDKQQATEVTLDLTLTAMEHSLLKAVTDTKGSTVPTANAVLEFYNTIFDSLHDPKEDKL